MTEARSTPKVRRGRIFPEIQWSEEKKAKWKAQQEAFRQRSQVIFDRVKPELIESHYNWYMAVEPDSGNYIVDRDKMAVLEKIRQTYPNTKTFLFRINETGVSGTI